MDDVGYKITRVNRIITLKSIFTEISPYAWFLAYVLMGYFSAKNIYFFVSPLIIPFGITIAACVLAHKEKKHIRELKSQYEPYEYENELLDFALPDDTVLLVADTIEDYKCRILQISEEEHIVKSYWIYIGNDDEDEENEEEENEE